ncbi:Dyp-type peroxidase [Muricoccus radiodurans]|uniref:Dyp-type peroxidase n=1 Tax=Muricoccus radiodurans TaxID=2231721 RepID=UPI003CEB3335
MTHAMVTVIAPLAPGRVQEAESVIDGLGNPPRDHLRTALDRLDGEEGTHFVSLHALRSADGTRAYLLLEFSADGTEEAALARIVAAIGEDLRPVFTLAADWKDGADLRAYLRGHQVRVGGGWFDNPGLAFAGTPGLSVGRIRAEARLAKAVATLLGQQPGDLHALERMEAVRARIADRPDLAFALEPADPEPPFEQPSVAAFVAGLAGSFAVTYLWPLGLLLLALAVGSGLHAAWPAHGAGKWLGAFLGGALPVLWTGLWMALLLVVVVVVIGLVRLRDAESRDLVEERAPDRATNAALFVRENRVAQNHMISVTQRKPGLLRWFTARLVFWAIGQFATRYYRPGFLSDIGTIHFARWVTAPRSPDLIFLSNYGGSWESYLEDFITRAHAGLTAVWSNSIGFPRTSYLIQGGATDGERFKRYARRSMVPTRFWYSAYPELTTATIRTNAEIRRGLSGAMTEDESTRWLSLFGSAARPASKLVTNEIQSLAFGGLGFLRFGTCLVFDLPEDRGRARDWLASVRPHIAFGDGRRLGREAVVILALGARGLARLGLPESCLDTFPFAFTEGMVTEARARILGDHGENGPAAWRWGQTPPDAALLVYGRTSEALEALEEALASHTTRLGMAAPHRIRMKPVSEDKREPFGFVDGVSQPVIRGTYKGLRNADPIHLVEPGEFVLGYPDNRGNIPPGPTLPAIADPANHLPLVTPGVDFGRTAVEGTRDVGFNGSYLVIRELEQDVAAFDAYCDAEAVRLTDRLSPPNHVTADFIGAKLVGRWKDGSSLARFPYEARSAGLGDDTPETARAPSGPAVAAPVQPPRRGSGRKDNDFLFGAEDPEALRCPFGAHIRRANPRDSLDPGSADQIAISNRHRILRVGRHYLEQDGANPGLLFMCLNGDIERQFEFLQQTWLRSPSFHGLSCEKDPLLGDAEEGACAFTIPSREGPVRLSPMPRFVTMRGGGYFFLPGKRLLDHLIGPQGAAA